METETLLAAMERAEAQTRGFTTYLSDNAPQFNLLKTILESKSMETVTWNFLPAHMPWAGGVYERLVQLVKRSLYATFREHIYLDETQFRTILKKLENMLNNRPLTYLAEEFDGKALIPNDFLQRSFQAQPVTIHPSTTDSRTASYLKHQLKQSEQVIEHFWQKWSTEYLQFLREKDNANNSRSKSLRREPMVGDVVLVADDVRKRRLWHLGKILQIQRSQDNEVRSVVLKLGTGTKIVRPVKDVLYMELNEYQDQQLQIPGDNGHQLGFDNIIA